MVEVYWVSERDDAWDVFYQAESDPRWNYMVARFFSHEEAEDYASMMSSLERDGAAFQRHLDAAPPENVRKNVFCIHAHMRDWDAASDDKLSKMWVDGHGKDEIAKAIGRTRQAIERRANYLGLPRRNKALAAFDARMRR